MMMTIVLAFDRIRDKDGGYVLIALQSEQTAHLLWVKVLIVVYWTALTSGSTKKSWEKERWMEFYFRTKRHQGGPRLILMWP